MGWGNCGTDSKGRRIGYVFTAKCDHPGCKKKIDRGLSFACGGEHGEGDFYCEGYFCSDHLKIAEPREGETRQFCPKCFEVANKIEVERVEAEEAEAAEADAEAWAYKEAEEADEGTT